ncbi:hypothetical protein D3C71_1380690 [compost metagenome]
MHSIATDFPAPIDAQTKVLRFSRCIGMGIGPIMMGCRSSAPLRSARRRRFSRRLAAWTLLLTQCQLAILEPRIQRRYAAPRNPSSPYSCTR